MTSVPPGPIDCDIHPSVPNMAALLPYLDDYWREMVALRGIDVAPHRRRATKAQRVGMHQRNHRYRHVRDRLIHIQHRPHHFLAHFVRRHAGARFALAVATPAKLFAAPFERHHMHIGLRAEFAQRGRELQHHRARQCVAFIGAIQIDASDVAIGSIAAYFELKITH